MLCKHSYISVRVWLQFAVSLLKYGFFSTVFLLARPVYYCSCTIHRGIPVLCLPVLPDGLTSMCYCCCAKFVLVSREPRGES